jgi:hypothetical protein
MEMNRITSLEAMLQHTEALAFPQSLHLRTYYSGRMENYRVENQNAMQLAPNEILDSGLNFQVLPRLRYPDLINDDEAILSH